MESIAELFDRAQHFHQRGDLRQAEPLYRQVLGADSGHAFAHHYLGLLAHQTGHRDAAISLMRQAISLNPGVAVFYSNLGVVLQAAGQTQEALDAATEALRLNPDLDDAHDNIGNLLREQGNDAEAIKCYCQALRLSPNRASSHYNLANVLKDQGQLAEAIASYRHALRLNPRHVDAYNNLGVALKKANQLAEAAECFREALRLDPNHAEAHLNVGIFRLLTGDFARGWPEYEYRWTDARVAIRSFDQPRWDGSALDGKTILIYAEQGLGDTIQFIRYAKSVKQRGGNVLFESEPQLLQLLANVAGIDRVVPRNQPLPHFDVQIPQLSLPGLFGTTLETIPAEVPYLCADAARVEHWRKELEPLAGLKIGISWQGSPSHRGDRQRSVPLALFESLAQLPSVHLVSFQKEAGSEQIKAQQGHIRVVDAGSQLGDMADTAALMMALDLVISVDTAVVHLAGALGKPTWVLLPFAPDWRWMLDREDSPWYPTMRLFRQRKPGDWSDVFERVAGEVRKEIQDRAGRK